MSKYRQAARTDDNQTEIVSELRKMGISVETNHDDILVGYNGLTFWFEIKTPDCRSKKDGKILQSRKKESQIKLEKEFKGHYKIVTDLDEILKDIGFKDGEN